MEALTNADAHPTHFQRVLFTPASSDSQASHFFPTGVSAGLQGNSQLSVVLEILSIGHSLDPLDLAVTSEVNERQKYSMKVRTEPKAIAVDTEANDFIYYQVGYRQWGRNSGSVTLEILEVENLTNTEHYAQNGYGLLIAAPMLHFHVKVTRGTDAGRQTTCSFHMLYRYRTVPFHMFKKLHDEQTVRGSALG